jgi:hypothetical protein
MFAVGILLSCLATKNSTPQAPIAIVLAPPSCSAKMEVVSGTEGKNGSLYVVSSRRTLRNALRHCRAKHPACNHPLIRIKRSALE